ncbi:DUF167 domain-containing protein [Persicirhabdus sediminis]|uniref:UPF0235 protein JIN82_10345 n=1 Tax=Persicirhabdus sediminis TaxID=454144 RepID=A0A8J7SIL7_9BACT|nr:DUF167 domain-containing protein [Persicirhabdus sediminis]MBK1791550.1 DUF167 domain-containing protein [Persicirhabdus sediminis]
MQLRIKATPNAKTNAIVGWEETPLAGRVLRIRIQAPPVEGKANKAIQVFLAKQLGVGKSKIQLQKGDTSRIKTFEIPDDCQLPDNF